jgi:putative acetyltransferase
MTELQIVEDDLSGEAIAALVALHLSGMQAHSPACKVHALPVAALRAHDVTFYSAWSGDALAGMGAIRHLAADHGELKSMRVAPAFLRQGVGEAMLRHLLGVARARGYARVSLETGRGAAFDPAIALYRKYGFAPCPAFADYVPDDFSQCLTLALSH